MLTEHTLRDSLTLVKFLTRVSADDFWNLMQTIETKYARSVSMLCKRGHWLWVIFYSSQVSGFLSRFLSANSSMAGPDWRRRAPGGTVCGQDATRR
jgi:hypothetical protein